MRSSTFFSIFRFRCFSGVKAQYSNEDQLVLDLALNWAGNSDIALVIKLLSLQLSVQVDLISFNLLWRTRGLWILDSCNMRLHNLVQGQLVDLQISGAIRIILRPFVPTFPCFSTIAISLMEKVRQSVKSFLIRYFVLKILVMWVQPRIDFGLRVMGGDIMAIPGLYQCVQVHFSYVLTSDCFEI